MDPCAPWDESVLLKHLQTTFKHESFRPFQLRAIQAILQGKDIFMTIPTGGGKSICYQMPATLMDGLTLVISPLLSLIKNQMTMLQRLDVPVAMFNSSAHEQSTIKSLEAWYDETSSREPLKILYTTPETLSLNDDIRAVLDRLHQANRIKLLAIDEVHCLSEWGHDFRPSYLYLKKLRRRYKVPCIACTATATSMVENDVRTILDMSSPVTIRKSFFRPNLKIKVVKCTSKHTYVARLIRKRFKFESGIIYNRTRDSCERMCHYLKNMCSLSTEYYHAGMNIDHRKRVQTRWESGETNIIIATLAFGMGIDKPDVRFVIHADLPKSISDYYQGIGRAGRDGNDATVYILYSDADHGSWQRLIRLSMPRTSPHLPERLRSLDLMLSFAKNRTMCRHRMLCAHFGERLARRCVNSCDNCAARVTETRDCSELCRAIFKAAMIMKSQSKFQCIYHWLCGKGKSSHSDFDLSSVSDAGERQTMMTIDKQWRGLSLHTFNHVITYLLINRYMNEEISNSGGQIKVTFRLTKRCIAILKRTKKVKLPVSPEDDWTILTDAMDDEPIAPAPSAPTKQNSELFNLLSDVRKRIANEQGVYEMYRIAYNSSLADMVRKMPKTLGELKKCRGMGKTRVAKYGTQFINCIEEYVNQAQATNDRASLPQASGS